MRKMKYTTRLETVETREGCWNTTKVIILEDGTEIGSYDRNYCTFYNTFVPFQQDDKWYALYSEDYTATAVMSLPNCKRIAGEEEDQWGFCPVDYHVPADPHDPEMMGEMEGKIGFVAGCVWGDDSSWKLQILDLSKITEGILIRDEETLGYLEVDTPLSESIHIYEYPYAKLKTFVDVNLTEKRLVNEDS